MGAAHSGDQTVAYTKSVDSQTGNTVEFALVPLRVFDSPACEAFTSLYKVYSPLGDPSALHFMNQSHRQTDVPPSTVVPNDPTAAEPLAADEPAATPAVLEAADADAVALSAEVLGRLKVLDFFCAGTERATKVRYYERNVEDPRGVPPDVNTTFPCAIAVRETVSGRTAREDAPADGRTAHEDAPADGRTAHEDASADDHTEDTAGNVGAGEGGWRFCGYVGMRAFNKLGIVGEAGTLSIFLDSGSDDRRGWSLLVFRLACRLYKDASIRHFGNVRWPPFLKWSCLANNVYCLSAQLRCAQFIADEEFKSLTHPHRAHQKTFYPEDFDPGEELYCGDETWCLPDPQPEVPPPEAQDDEQANTVLFHTPPAAIDGVVPLMDDIGAIQRPDSGEAVDGVPVLSFNTVHRRDVARRCGELLARSISAMRKRDSGLPAGLGALLPSWNAATDVCLEATGVDIHVRTTNIEERPSGRLLRDLRRLYRPAAGIAEAPSSAVCTMPVHPASLSSKSVSTTGQIAWGGPGASGPPL